jgi:hypothetical protein
MTPLQANEHSLFVTKLSPNDTTLRPADLPYTKVSRFTRLSIQLNSERIQPINSTTYKRDHGQNITAGTVEKTTPLTRAHYAKKLQKRKAAFRLTACVTGGWGETTHETGNCYRSEPSPQNAQSPSRPVHALLGAV